MSKKMSDEFKKVLQPFWMVRNWLLKTIHNSKKQKYIPKKYWKKRHKKYGFDLRGVGNCSLSSVENEKMYQQARETFEELCTQEGINLPNAKILDIGCGTGFYAEVFRSYGNKNYLGIDITDQLFFKLKNEFPSYRFNKLDITKDTIDERFDVIIMIDVSQHIVDDMLFSSAMKTIYSCLSENGTFIVTSWLSDQFKKKRPYEVERPISYYKKEFMNVNFSNPLPFRDKYIFTIRKRV